MLATLSRRMFLNAYVLAVVAVLAAFAVQTVLGPEFGSVFALVPFCFAVMFAARVGGIGPACLALVLGYAAASYFFMRPGSLVIRGKDDLAALAIYILIGLSTGLLAESLHRLRRNAEETRERLRVTLASIGDAVIAADAKGRVTALNTTAERITGWREGEAFGRRFDEILRIVHETTAEPADDLKRQALEQIGPVRFPDRSVLLSRQGASIPIEGSAAPIHSQDHQPTGVVFTLRDVTEQRRAEDALRASEERFRTLADSAPVMIWISDADKACTWFNRPWLAFTGRTMAQELGFGWADSIHPDDFERCLETYHAAFDLRKNFRMEYRLRRHDGQFRWVLDQGMPLDVSGRGFVGYIGSAVDIHEKTEVEEMLKEADRRKNEFLAMLAHELRNPLTTIQYANSVARLADGGGDKAGYSNIIEAQVKHLARLIDDLLDVARITRDKIELHTEVLDAADVIRRAVEATRPLVALRGHQLRVQLDRGAIRLVADPTRLEQIVQNLVNNAAKYTPEGGQIDIRARAGDGELVLTVKDNGVGMSRKLIPTVFEPFIQGERTLDRSQGGLGIGLTLVRKLVEMHGGTVAAESEGLGRGSLFTVRLPLASSDAARDSEREESVAAHGPLRVVVVEDNVDSAKSLAMLLEHAGHQVAMCHSGTDALDTARRHDADVVLLDIGLPGVDGYGVARQLRQDERFRDVRIIGISGYGQEHDRQQSRQAGFDHHLIKPVDFRHLASLLAGVEPGRARAAI